MNFFSASSPSNSAARVYLQPDFVQASLVKGNFRQICALPKYMDLNEWFGVFFLFTAVLLDFFYYTNLFYESVAEFCTVHNCPNMSAGANIEYSWTDSKAKSVKLPAPQYVDYFMTWTQSILNDQSVFPTKAGIEFPPNFLVTLKAIYKHIMRVFVHMYSAHVHQIQMLNLQSHLNTLFAHLLCFGREFELLERKDLVSVQDFVSALDALYGLNLGK
ncbi:MOB kinase activator 1A-like protein [Chytriomyces cf. hyalinus JEL632]|nr:MOB kinase activator 1A-like protein [Chytriomyces cf. hyalinus JEL632]